MPQSPRPSRKQALARRLKKQELRRALLNGIVGGRDQATLARAAGVSVATVRREVDRALAEPRSDDVATYVKLQQARLDKALRFVFANMDRGNLRAVPALAVVLRELDRYQGLKGLIEAGKHAPDVAALQNVAPKLLESLILTTKTHTHPAAP